MKLITIAIPFFNAEKYLKEAVQSVIDQTYRNWHLILMDDGSTDSSLQIAEELAKNDSRITVYSDGLNKNLGQRLNEISSITKTQFLARMDADDIMHPTRIGKQIKTLLENPKIDVLGTNAYSIDENGKTIGIRLNPQHRKELFPVDSFIHPSIMGKTKWFQKNPYDVKAVRIEDAELWLRTKAHSKFYCLAEPLLYYREIGNKYYTKYFKAFPSLLYLLKKPTLPRIIFAVQYSVASLRSYAYFKLGKEKEMIRKRNEVQDGEFL